MAPHTLARSEAAECPAFLKLVTHLCDEGDFTAIYELARTTAAANQAFLRATAEIWLEEGSDSHANALCCSLLENPSILPFERAYVHFLQSQNEEHHLDSAWDHLYNASIHLSSLAKSSAVQDVRTEPLSANIQRAMHAVIEANGGRSPSHSPFPKQRARSTSKPRLAFRKQRDSDVRIISPRPDDLLELSPTKGTLEPENPQEAPNNILQPVAEHPPAVAEPRSGARGHHAGSRQLAHPQPLPSAQATKALQATPQAHSRADFRARPPTTPRASYQQRPSQLRPRTVYPHHTQGPQAQRLLQVPEKQPSNKMMSRARSIKNKVSHYLPKVSSAPSGLTTTSEVTTTAKSPGFLRRTFGKSRNRDRQATSIDARGTAGATDPSMFYPDLQDESPSSHPSHHGLASLRACIERDRDIQNLFADTRPLARLLEEATERAENGDDAGFLACKRRIEDALTALAGKHIYFY